MGGRVYIATSQLESRRVAQARPDAEVIEHGELGFYELLKTGMPRDEVELELTPRAVKRIGARRAVVDFDFP
ncbi:MAG TPA: hypothetical protein VFL87_01540, partial [Thermoleophilaceae bacterium]|nr:hypothetical protein [Thermoleophilaceae bacterium]